jgi:hypothetical protein
MRMKEGTRLSVQGRLFFFFFLVVNFMKMEDMLCIENIGENTLASLFLTNSRDNIVGFVSSRKVVEGMYF